MMPIPYRINPKTSYTRVPMYADVPSLDTRVTDEKGVAVLRFIADRQKRLLGCSAYEVGDYDRLPGLELAGYVASESVTSKASATREVRLTDAGWEMIGGKPFWMG